MHQVLQKIRHGIVVSAQASQGEPLNQPDYLCAMAESALNGGACGLRMAQLENLRYFRTRHPEVPLIGITKPEKIPANAHELIYITPTFEAVASIAKDCDIVALDATLRPRVPTESLADIVEKARRQFPNLLLMADIATLEDAQNAENLGFDLIGTTLSGYTSETLERQKQGPDFELLANLIRHCKTPVIMEGRLWEPAEVGNAFALGAFSVVIGSAVTRPHEITRRFVRAISSSARA